MPTFIQVRASNKPHKGTYTPHRFWPDGQTIKLEVVADQVAIDWLDKNRPQRKGNEDPGARALEIAGGPYLPDGTPDPGRITESGLDHIRGNKEKRIEPNQHLSMFGEGEAGGAMAQAAIDTARAAAARSSEKLVDAEIALTEATAKVEELTEENKKLRVQVAELVAELETLKGEPETEPKGKGKHEKGSK